MSDVFLVDLPLTGEPARIEEDVTALVTGWLEERVGVTPVLEGSATNADKTAEVTHRLRRGTAGAVSRWTVHQVREGWTWRTTLWLIRVGEEVSFRVWLAVEAIGDRLVELRRPLGRPGVVGSVLTRQLAVVDGFRLGAPLTLGADDAHGLISFLLNPDRTLPVVVLTHPAAEPVDKNVAVRLADAIGGLAHVVDLPTADATGQLTEALGTYGLAVADGAVRLYWPGLRPGSNPGSHLLLTADRVRARGIDAIASGLFRRLARSSVLAPAVPPIEQQLGDEEAAAARAITNGRLADLQRQLADRPASLPSGHTVVEDDFYLEFEKALDTATSMQTERDKALADLKEARNEVVRLTQQVEVERANINAYFAAGGASKVGDDFDDEEPPGGGDEVDEEPASVADAVRIAERVCTHLTFLKEARESAAESHYPNPSKVLSDLRAVDAVAARWRANELRGGFKSAFHEHGLTGYRRGVSQTAQTSFRSDYAREYQGKTVLLGPHLRSGVGAVTEILRIYWYQDSQDRTLVIGHVGRKLRDDSNS